MVVLSIRIKNVKTYAKTRRGAFRARSICQIVKMGFLKIVVYSLWMFTVFVKSPSQMFDKVLNPPPRAVVQNIVLQKNVSVQSKTKTVHNLGYFLNIMVDLFRFIQI